MQSTWRQVSVHIVPKKTSLLQAASTLEAFTNGIMLDEDAHGIAGVCLAYAWARNILMGGQQNHFSSEGAIV